jgi:ABC-type antimicrobial peptide transport system permease subunit
MLLAFELACRSIRWRPHRLAGPAIVVASTTLTVLVATGFYLGLLDAAVAWLRTLPGDTVIASADGNPAFTEGFSQLSRATVRAVRGTPGVAAVHEVYRQRAWVGHGDRDTWIQLVGIRPDASFGGPLRVVAGRARPLIGEIVVDEVVADDLGVALGDGVKIQSALLGTATLRVVGIASGGNTVIGSYAFVSRATLALGGVLHPSHLFVSAAPGQDVDALRAALATVPAVQILGRAAFEEQNRRFFRQVFGPVIGVIDAVAALAAVVIVAVVLHAGSVARRPDYGLVAALGPPRRLVHGWVVLEALLASALGVAVGAGAGAGLVCAIPRFAPRFVARMPPWLLVAAGVVAIGIGVAAALRPARDAARTDPALVFRF